MPSEIYESRRKSLRVGDVVMTSRANEFLWGSDDAEVTDKIFELSCNDRMLVLSVTYRGYAYVLVKGVLGYVSLFGIINAF